jgi:flagellar hook-basal body complex protein FliE
MAGLRIDPGHIPGVKRDTEKVENKHGPGFKEFVKSAIKRVNESHLEANESIEQLATGKTGIHETMISLQKADISMRLFLQIRNKAMEAYREIMRMPF